MLATDESLLSFNVCLMLDVVILEYLDVSCVLFLLWHYNKILIWMEDQ